MKTGIPVAAIFWVNASRVIPPLTIPNVKNTGVLILSLKEKKTKFNKKQEKKKKETKKKGQTEKNKKRKRTKTGAVVPEFLF